MKKKDLCILPSGLFYMRSNERRTSKTVEAVVLVRRQDCETKQVDYLCVWEHGGSKNKLVCNSETELSGSLREWVVAYINLRA